MYNSQDLAIRIKSTAKERKKVIKDMLVACEIGSNAMSGLYHGKSIAFDSLAKIADYLDVSVDYLLGRADEPTEIKQNNVVNVNNSGDNNTNNVSIGKASTEDISEITEMIKNLSLIERSKVILFIEEMKTKNKSTSI